MRIKTGLNKSNKWPKFEKNLNANVLQIFAFALQMIPLTMSGTDTDEYPYSQ